MKRIADCYNALFSCYGEQHWWPCRSGNRWEIITGAILTQNCAWRNVELALDQLAALDIDTPDRLLGLDDETLQNAIRSAGFFKQKSVYLREIAHFVIANESEFLSRCTLPELQLRRQRLLEVKGVGRETADSILLYAFSQPLFVIDAYTRRISARHLGIADAATMPYDRLQAIFTANLPAETPLYNEYHALIVQHCKHSCQKQRCIACNRIFA